MGEPTLHVVSGTATEGDAARIADDDLMRLAKAGRQDAFALLVRRHQGLVLGLATRFLNDPTLGRDVAQDVFLSLWAERGRYRPQGRFRSYLVKVTLNRCKVATRQRRSESRKRDGLRRERMTRGADVDADEAPLARLVEAERAREVRAQVAALPERTRAVLVLRYTHELPLDAIAAATGMPLGTVKSHVFRGLRRLHRALGGGER